MINYIRGNIFDSDAEALVNPVNCVGVMGRGLALEFKRKFPDNFAFYHEQCRLGEVVIGRMAVFDHGEKPKYIINFPTKEHWGNNSKLSYIEKGLDGLCLTVNEFYIRSIALPMLGCGLGGLNWDEVRPVMENHLSALDKVDVCVYFFNGRQSRDSMAT